MFRAFTQSARGVLEESFLMITDSHIIEMRSNKLNLSTGNVTFAIPIEMLAKLKFRRQESISLFFKPAPDDPLIYMCPDSADCVHQIQSVLKKHGVKGSTPMLQRIALSIKLFTWYKKSKRRNWHSSTILQ